MAEYFMLRDYAASPDQYVIITRFTKHDNIFKFKYTEIHRNILETCMGIKPLKYTLSSERKTFYSL